jgi:predicted nuclease of predicted toxin-antitoxin system
MRFLADESCDFAVVRALRVAGCDVLAVSETAPGADDKRVMQLAIRGRRVLLTEDKDFGQLVYADRRTTAGVILIRFPASARSGVGDAVVELVGTHGDQLERQFIVVQPGRVRIAHAPQPGKKR